MKKKAYFFSKKSLEIIESWQDKWRVFSVFKNSINIITPEEALLTLLSKEKEVYRNPISIVIDESGFEDWNLAPGDTAIYRNNAILFPEKDIEIDISNKVIWSSSFRYFGPLLSPPLIRKNIETLKFFIKVMNWNRGMIPLVVEGFSPSNYTKKASLVLDDFSSSPPLHLEKLRPLVGLGDGLTPSGDDFLSGFFIILYYFGRYLDMEKEITSAMKVILDVLPSKTNIVSATFLNLAAQGEAFFLLREIIKDLLGRRGFDMENIKVLMEYGGTSGASILTGVIFGIEYVLTHLYREAKEVTV